MGYYLETDGTHHKAQYLLNKFGGTAVQRPPESMDDVSDYHAVVCVVNNGLFEAAGIAYSDAELKAFSRPEDHRPKTWLILLDRQKVYDAAKVRQEDR